jgi:hypothetical protein
LYEKATYVYLPKNKDVLVTWCVLAYFSERKLGAASMQTALCIHTTAICQCVSIRPSGRPTVAQQKLDPSSACLIPNTATDVASSH